MCEERNYGERVLLKGGYWDDNTYSGLFEPSVDSMREFSCPYMGFRAYGESLSIYGADDAVNAGSGIYAYALNEKRGDRDTVVGFRASSELW